MMVNQCEEKEIVGSSLVRMTCFECSVVIIIMLIYCTPFSIDKIIFEYIIHFIAISTNNYIIIEFCLLI